MTQMHKGFLLIGVFLYAAFVAPKIYAATPDAVNQVLQQGLPAQPAALATLTEELKKEYEARHNVVALVRRPAHRHDRRDLPDVTDHPAGALLPPVSPTAVKCTAGTV